MKALMITRLILLLYLVKEGPALPRYSLNDYYDHYDYYNYDKYNRIEHGSEFGSGYGSGDGNEEGSGFGSGDGSRYDEEDNIIISDKPEEKVVEPDINPEKPTYIDKTSTDFEFETKPSEIYFTTPKIIEPSISDITKEPDSKVEEENISGSGSSSSDEIIDICIDDDTENGSGFSGDGSLETICSTKNNMYEGSGHLITSGSTLIPTTTGKPIIRSTVGIPIDDIFVDDSDMNGFQSGSGDESSDGSGDNESIESSGFDSGYIDEDIKYTTKEIPPPPPIPTTTTTTTYFKEYLPSDDSDFDSGSGSGSGDGYLEGSGLGSGLPFVDTTEKETTLHLTSTAQPQYDFWLSDSTNINEDFWNKVIDEPIDDDDWLHPSGSGFVNDENINIITWTEEERNKYKYIPLSPKANNKVYNASIYYKYDPHKNNVYSISYIDYDDLPDSSAKEADFSLD